MKRTFAVAGVGLCCAGALGQDLCLGFSGEVLFSEIPGHPTAVAPGLGIDFTGFLSLYTSPDGNRYIFKAFINDPENDVVVVGDSDSGTAAVVARENQPTAVPGSVHSFLDSDCGINDDGVYAYGSRLEGVPTSADEVIFAGDSMGQSVAAREGEPAMVFQDPFGVGDETYGNSLNSVHVLADGRVGYRADLLNNVQIDFESALYQGSIPVLQEGTTVTFGASTAVVDSTAALSGNTFTSSPDGSVWIVEGDITPGVGTTEAVIVNGAVELFSGMLIKDANKQIDGIFAVNVDNQGNWYARGDFADDTDWVVRNGEVIALTGAPIRDGSPETWGDVISGVSGWNGSYAVTGNTSNPDADENTVVVVDNSFVLAREGDSVFLSGRDVEIASFSANDFWLGDVPKAFVTLRDSATGADLGDAMVTWFQAASCNPADLAQPCGILDLADIQVFITGFVNQEDYSDLAAPSGVWDLQDVQAFVSGFVNGCP